MPKGDGTGPDGKGPKQTQKGWPKRDGSGQGGNRKGGRGQGGGGLRKRDGSCKQP